MTITAGQPPQAAVTELRGPSSAASHFFAAAMRETSSEKLIVRKVIADPHGFVVQEALGHCKKM